MEHFNEGTGDLDISIQAPPTEHSNEEAGRTRRKRAALPRDYADLVSDRYARWTLDPVIELAFLISKDFIARPDFYRGDGIPLGIVDLRVAYGTTAALPNRAQRYDINFPIFGASDAYAVGNSTDKFRSVRMPLFEASITYSERTIAQSIEGLRQRIRSALKLFQPHLKNFEGASFNVGYRQLESVSDLAFDILRSAGVSQVFGVNPPPDPNWPINSNDPRGALLIRTIGEKHQLQPEFIFTEERFQRLRRVAEQGRDAIKSILQAADNPDDRALDALATTIYTWAIALRDYQGTTVEPSLTSTPTS